MLQERDRSSSIDIDRVTRGEKAAWDQFVDTHAGLLYSVALRTLRMRSQSCGAEDARDVVQDIFLRLVKDDFRLLRSYDRDRASLGTWLTVVARSAAIDFLRRPENGRVTVELDEEMPAERDVRPAGLLDLPPGILSERQGQILRMLFDEDMDVSEIAGALRVQSQTVRSLKHQALTRLREYYGTSRPA
ncbi:RNA polymerase sigma factor [Fundidesulfovibrio terrae]|uniref:RNA polymerase sigma factor n=1 Tax=Fundidesulfovibrio terrae TaxID=2922866 RepID=UPI001FAEDE74|nr:sigma-70 family RNA polymerase sigma factor [Fundidesulfovibrio terrae]